MDEKRFRAYIADFNAADHAKMAEYYAPEVNFCFANGITLAGREAVFAFYGPMHDALQETVEIVFLVMDASHVAVELDVTFRARKDFDKFTRGPLKAGDTVRFTSFCHYDLDGAGRFTEIRIGNYRDR